MRTHILKTVKQTVMTYDTGAVLFIDDHSFLPQTHNNNRYLPHGSSSIVT